MDAFRGLPLCFRNFQSVLYMNALDDEHPILCFFDFSADVTCQLAVCLDFARFQRAPEGSKQSTRDRCNQIIYGRGMGFPKIFSFHSIMLGNGSMHTEDHRFGFAGKLGVPDRSLFSFNVRVRYISNLSHSFSPPSKQQNPNPL
jgi:hypothetical protein